MQKYGLLGKKISYSLSPSMQTAAFKALGIEATYEIFDRPENGVEKFFADMREGRISGCNITVPYKESALKLVDAADELAREVGAVNTVVKKNGNLIGHNTDCAGFVEALRGSGAGNLDFNAYQKSAFLFGAGGAARAVTYSLLGLGIKKIYIADIDNKKAESLAASVSEKVKGSVLITVVSEKRQYDDFISRADLLVNATPSGMKKDDEPLFDYRYIHEKLYVFDLIYAVDTLLLKEARTRAKAAINGMNMLLYQAAHSFTLWTEKAAPLDVMRRALTEKIKK